MIKLTRKVLLLSAMAYGVGCADAGEEPAEELSTEEIVSEAEAKKVIEDNNLLGELAKAEEAEGVDGIPDTDGADTTPTALAEAVGEPTVAALKRNGPYRTGRFNTSGAGKSYGGSTIFYPADAPNNDVPGVVMCPGFTALKSSIAGWGPFFASHGITLMTIDTKTPMDIVQQRGGQIKQAMQDLQQLAKSDNRLSKIMSGATAWGVSGWSMGGGGTWINAANNAGSLNLKTAVTLAGHNMSAGGTAGVGARNIRIPTLMMNGSTDVTILGGLGQSSGAYNAIPNNTPKMVWETGTCGHFCWGGPGAGRNMSGVLMMAWQKTFLLGDERFKTLLNCNTAREGSSTTTCRTNVQ